MNCVQFFIQCAVKMVKRFVDVDPCKDSFVKIKGWGATSDSKPSIPPIEGVTTVEDCKASCLGDSKCEGFSLITGNRHKCQLYNLKANNTIKDDSRELYVRERCPPFNGSNTGILCHKMDTCNKN